MLLIFHPGVAPAAGRAFSLAFYPHLESVFAPPAAQNAPPPRSVDLQGPYFDYGGHDGMHGGPAVYKNRC